jgi:von Willebrand factor type A domain
MTYSLDVSAAEAEGETTAGALTLDPITWKQSGILVLDGSGSMTLPLAEQDESLGLPVRTKGAAVDAAVKGFFAQMETSRAKSNFAFGIVTFEDKVTHERPPEPITGINHISESFDPTDYCVTGGTAIYEGLEAGYRLSRDWLAAEEGTLPVTSVIAVLTDGECSNPTRTFQLAERIKSEEPRISIACGMFATKGAGTPGTQLLQAMVTEPRLYAVIYSADQLREWFHASLTGTGVAAKNTR